MTKKSPTAPQGKTTIESQSLLAKKAVFDVFFGDYHRMITDLGFGPAKMIIVYILEKRYMLSSQRMRRMDVQ